MPARSSIFSAGLFFAVACGAAREVSQERREPETATSQAKAQPVARAPAESDGARASEAPQGWIPTADYTPPDSELEFSAPPGWIVQTPSSPTCKAQYLLPRADGDAEDASVVVDYFGPSGNVDRKADLERGSRFGQPDGSDSVDHLRRMSSTAMGYYQDEDGKLQRWCLIRHDVDISGTYVAEASPSSGERLHKEGWRMLATILDTGPHYVELVGPAATVAHWAPSYERFVDSARPRGWRSNWLKNSTDLFPDGRGVLR